MMVAGEFIPRLMIPRFVIPRLMIPRFAIPRTKTTFPTVAYATDEWGGPSHVIRGMNPPATVMVPLPAKESRMRESLSVAC